MNFSRSPLQSEPPIPVGVPTIKSAQKTGAQAGLSHKMSPSGGQTLRLRARSSDLGGNRLSEATSVRPYLQGFAPPGVNRPLRDKTGRKDPDFYRLFDNVALNTFQSEGLLLSCQLRNRSNAPISITLLDQQGKPIAGSRQTVQAGRSFVYPEGLSETTYYIKITSKAAGQNRYELNLSIINS
ncbi:MAG: hypothetical protein MUF72_04470 [Elainella sp. Prado103]|jgi:hypothetical protein|nr:hypothetical protein [Elainella sp. Prado103]